jgi:hypothetical protein
MTPLKLAALHGRERVVRALLHADPAAAFRHEGRTPAREIAIEGGHAQLAAVLDEGRGGWLRPSPGFRRPGK